MNKTELINAVADKTQLSKKDAEAAITATVEAIAEALTREEKVQLVGFGSFEVKTRAARVGRNPKTGTEIEIPQTKTPVFKAGKALKDSVNKYFFLEKSPSPMAVRASSGSLQRLSDGAFFVPCPPQLNAVS